MNYWDTQATEQGVLASEHAGDGEYDRITDYQLGLISQRLPENGVVRDIGAGVGRLIIPLAELRPDLEFYASEPSKEMRRALTVNAQGLSNVRVDPGGPVRGPLHDLVYCVLVLQHNDEDGVNDIVTQALEGLKPGGRVLMQFVRGDEFTEHGPRSFDYTVEQFRTWMGGGAQFFHDECGYCDSWWWVEL